MSMKCILQNKTVPGSVSCDSNGWSTEWYLVEHSPNTEKIFFCWFNITRARHHKWAYNARCSGDRITARGMCLFLWTALRQDNQLKTLRRRIIAEWQLTKPPATPFWCTYKYRLTFINWGVTHVLLNETLRTWMEKCWATHMQAWAFKCKNNSGSILGFKDWTIKVY